MARFFRFNEGLGAFRWVLLARRGDGSAHFARLTRFAPLSGFAQFTGLARSVGLGRFVGCAPPRCWDLGALTLVALVALVALVLALPSCKSRGGDGADGTRRDASSAASVPFGVTPAASGQNGATSLEQAGHYHAGPLTVPFVPAKKRELQSQRTLFVVNYAHLDTAWRWTYASTIERFLPDTIARNASAFGRFPHHVFNFTGASRYEMWAEYYPEDFQRIKRWVAEGRWFPAGNQWEECDVLLPSSESLLRQILLGRRFFKEHFGTESQEFMLPDSFGFPASLPSILAHAGLRGFSTQKLSWDPAKPIPFRLGKWEGVDGSGVIAALDAGNYGKKHKTVVSSDPAWVARLDENGRRGGLKVDYLYNGTGDVGGAPHDVSLQTMEQSIRKGGPVRVVVGQADELFKSIGDEQAEGLPKYRGDLLLREHSAGSLTSQAFMKALNRSNEILADSAERALVAASGLGALPYPLERMRRAWGLVLRSQFHDVITGTSLPTVYEHAHNDEFLAMNEFVHSLEDAVGAIARGLDTRSPKGAKDGVPIIVYNPLAIDRRDVVELELPRSLVNRGAISVIDPEGGVSPVQISGQAGEVPRALFLARLPSLGTSVFTLIPGETQRTPAEVFVSTRGLENDRYRVALNEQGDLAQIFDKSAKRDVFSAPMRLSLHTEWPSAFPAWNMDWADRKQPPRDHVGAEPKIEILEDGPIRVSLRIEREAAESRFVQILRLSAGSSGDRLEVAHRIDWKTPGSSLKATLPFTFGRRDATYNWGLGTMERGNNDESQFEVPSHGWIDLTDRSGDYGMTVLTGAKYGSDKPEDAVLRLTLLYTPVAADEYREQGTQDFGRHDFSIALVGHSGALSKAWAEWERLRFEYPPIAFRVRPHGGTLGRTFRFLSTSNSQIAVQALKRSEDGRRIVIRLRELEGRRGNVAVRAHSPFLQAWEMTGAESEIGVIPVNDGTLRLAFSPNQLRTIGVRLKESAVVPNPTSRAIELPFDVDAVSGNANRADGNLDGAGGSLPAEQLPGIIEQGGVKFILGGTEDGQLNAVAARGQRLSLPAGYSRVHVLATAAFEVADATFTIGGQSRVVRVPRWTGYVGQWDRRVFRGGVPELSFSVDAPLVRVEPAFLDTTRVAWWASHRHRAPASDLAYRFSYLFTHAFEFSDDGREMILPQDPRILVFAVSVSRDANDGALLVSSVWPDLRRDVAFRARFAEKE